MQTGAVQPAVERVYPGDCSEAQCQHGLFNQITLVKGRYPHRKFILSVGGWTDSGPFYEMALRNAIAPSKLLTVAVGAGARAIDRLECAEMAVVLDWVNVMTYDFHSGGRRAGFNSALYNHDDPTNARSNTDAAVQALLTKALRERSWLVGVPLYGRGWRGVEPPGLWVEGSGADRR